MTLKKKVSMNIHSHIQLAGKPNPFHPLTFILIFMSMNTFHFRKQEKQSQKQQDNK